MKAENFNNEIISSFISASVFSNQKYIFPRHLLFDKFLWGCKNQVSNTYNEAQLLLMARL